MTTVLFHKYTKNPFYLHLSIFPLTSWNLITYCSLSCSISLRRASFFWKIIYSYTAFCCYFCCYCLSYYSIFQILHSNSYGVGYIHASLHSNQVVYQGLCLHNFPPVFIAWNDGASSLLYKGSTSPISPSKAFLIVLH